MGREGGSRWTLVSGRRDFQGYLRFNFAVVFTSFSLTAATDVIFPDFWPMRVSEELVCFYLFRQNPVFTSLHLRSPVHLVPPQAISWTIGNSLRAVRCAPPFLIKFICSDWNGWRTVRTKGKLKWPKAEMPISSKCCYAPVVLEHFKWVRPVRFALPLGTEIAY